VKKRDFLDIRDLTPDEYKALFNRTRVVKEAWHARRVIRTLASRTLVMIFEKPSTRTRLSFEAAMKQLGGEVIDLSTTNSQLGRGEPLSDTARVASRYCNVIMMRTSGDDRLKEVADNAPGVPVINGLTDGGHPVQILADLFTIEERLGTVEGKTLAFIGDTANNMGRSYAKAAPLFGFKLKFASPKGYHPSEDILALSDGRVECVTDPKDAVKGADVVMTDVWTSMGMEDEKKQRLKEFAGYQVDAALMKLAKKDAIFLHCLPAHRGEEVSAEVLEGPQSAVWDQAENRLHVQKALIEYLVLETEKVTKR